jgi:hypothetical protein
MLNLKFGIFALLLALLAVGCAAQGQDLLNPPGVRVYRGPQVRVTHAPIESPVSGARAETTTPGPLATQPQAMPMMSDEEYEQYLADTIESLLDRIEGKLDRTDVNP